MDIKNLYRYLDKFRKTPSDKLSPRKLEKLYDVLLDFLVEHDDELEDDMAQLMQDTLDILELEIGMKDMALKNLSAKLIKDPAEVERILSQMCSAELLSAEKKGRRLRSPALRKQFANMIKRHWLNDFPGIC